MGRKTLFMRSVQKAFCKSNRQGLMKCDALMSRADGKTDEDARDSEWVFRP
jgi:hypothetical protein